MAGTYKGQRLEKSVTDDTIKRELRALEQICLEELGKDKELLITGEGKLLPSSGSGT